MIETRMLSVSTLPRPVAHPVPRRGAERHASPPPARAAVRVPSPARAAARRRDRLARSEARLLTLAVAGTALMCAVLVVYLAAYAHVSQLGVEQAQARVQLRQVLHQNDQLQAQLAGLQSPSRIVAAAQALGMTSGTNRVTYLSFPRNGGQNLQVANGGTTADSSAAALDH